MNTYLSKLRSLKILLTQITTGIYLNASLICRRDKLIRITNSKETPSVSFSGLNHSTNCNEISRRDT